MIFKLLLLTGFYTHATPYGNYLYSTYSTFEECLYSQWEFQTEQGYAWQSFCEEEKQK